MRILVHVCCAHCLEATLAGLKHEFGDKLQAHGYFYNPNIHPLIEFRKRLKAVKVLNEVLRLPMDYEEAYGLDAFLRTVWASGAAERCRRCYDERLGATARHARAHGFEAFTSTLCVSGHQHHDEIRAAGESAAAREGVRFAYRDLRAWPARTPRRRGVYAQQYCGCIFSETERFRTTRKELYKGPSGPDSA